MCRWMAWHGQPVLIEELLFKTQHGIVDQSLHSRMGAEMTNGDGFGVGWYGAGEGPGVYHSVAPAWGDANLRELAAHVASPLFLVHVRAAIGSPIQQTNCHPFRHGRWLFVHNGYVGDFAGHPAGPHVGDRSEAVRRHRGVDRHGGRVQARAHVRARGGSDRGARAHGRADRGDRHRVRRRADGAGHLRHLGRQQPVGRAVRDRGPGAVALRVGRRRLAARAVSREEDVVRDGDIRTTG